jgi:hypothetical protein
MSIICPERERELRREEDSKRRKKQSGREGKD